MKPRRERSQKSFTVAERKALSPMFVVGAVAVAALFLLSGANYISRSLVARLDPNISIEASGEDQARKNVKRKDAAAGTDAIFDGEVYRTEGRLREAAALAVATSLAGVGAIAEHRSVRSVTELIDDVMKRNLLPPGLVPLKGQAAFAAQHGTLYVRFRPQPFGVEILSLPGERLDGACLLLRVPEGNQARDDFPLRYFQAMKLDGVPVPPPFVLDSEVLSLGWTIETMRTARVPKPDEQSLIAWLRQMNEQR
jgi:hypothetical protein